MQFKKITDKHVQITTSDGTKYELKKVEAVPVTRWVNSSPYQVQDELKITFEGLFKFIDLFDKLSKLDGTSKAEIQNEIARLNGLLREKVLMAQEIDTIKLQLASVFWLFPDEDQKELDPMLMAQKVQLMKSSQAAYSFFLRSPIPFQLSETTVTIDTVLFLGQMTAIQSALSQPIGI